MSDPLDGVIAALIERLGEAVLTDAPLGAMTTYRVGGTARARVTISSESELHNVVELLAGTGVAILTVGRGSNLLVADAGFEGIAIHLAGVFAHAWVDGSHLIAGAAAKLPVAARTAVQGALSGFEWAVGVPGSIGGAVRMNAGGHGAEIIDSLIDADVVDFASGERAIRPAAGLELSYRQSALNATETVIGARFALAPGSPDAGKAAMAEIVKWRRVNQPGGQNAGSVFTNPPGDSAGRLIDAVGASGLRIGTAAVSEKHANFIQADETGTAADVVAVMDEVKRLVVDAYGVVLHPETHLVGFSIRELDSNS